MPLILGDVGYYLLLLCLIVNVYGTVASLSAARLRHRRLYLSAKAAQTGSVCSSV